MRITTKEVRSVAGILDDLVKVYKEKLPKKKRNWRTYEQRLAERIKTAMKELEPLIEEATHSLKLVKAEPRGRKQGLTLKQKTVLLLLKHLFGKSNREMSVMLVVFSLLSGIDVSYKTVERLYSDEEVILVLRNIHTLLLKKKGVKEVEGSGDGTGYSLTIRKHYASEVEKRKDKAKTGSGAGSKKKVFAYFFALLDLESRMYVAYGASFRSEKQAFQKAVEMLKETDIELKSMRLDRYYSFSSCVDELGEAEVFVIPRKNSTVKGSWKWKRTMYEFVNHTPWYLQEYYLRSNSESGFSEDKRRFGWKIAQRREDRVDTAAFCTVLWHNLFWLG